MKTKIAVTILCGLLVSNYANCAPGSDSTSLNIKNYSQATQRYESTGTSANRSQIDIPTQQVIVMQPIYVTNPPTEPTTPPTVQCSSYTTVHGGYRYATIQEANRWGGCVSGGTYGAYYNMPEGTVRFNNVQDSCHWTAWGVPTYKNVCNG